MNLFSYLYYQIRTSHHVLRDKIRHDVWGMLGALSEGFYPRSENGQRPGDEVVMNVKRNITKKFNDAHKYICVPYIDEQSIRNRFNISRMKIKKKY